MAVSPTIAASGRGPNGSAFFVDGMSSGSDPMFISDRSYRYAENVLHRGGVLRTRPGYVEMFVLPEGKLQGFTYFRPLGGTEYLVFAVAGTIYASQYPFEDYTEVADIAMYEHAPIVYFSSAIRSAERGSDGEIAAIEPLRTLMIQDGGFTRAAYWDGVSSGHIDPTTVSDDEGVLSAGTPLGGPMAWSGDRLWVARDNKVFASDIADPLSFVENEYAGEGGFFLFDDDVVAMIDVPLLSGNSLLVVFTKNQTYTLRAGIRTRSLWKSTENFKQTLFPDVGCVSHRSVAIQNGLLWWMTHNGLTNLNAAQNAMVSSRLSPQDTPMSVSKGNLNSNLGTVALGVFENYLLVSVPYGDLYNTHTWVLDQVPVDQASNPTWAGVWTGTRPVEWVSVKLNGVPRSFYVSKDFDGENRLWEAFTSEPTDNGVPIGCLVETKTHIDFSPKATGLDLKEFKYGETSFTDVLGDVEVEVSYAGTRGKYKTITEHSLVATPGSITYGPDFSEVESHLSQSRVLRTPNVSNSAGVCSSCNIESNRADWHDVGFSLLIGWTGQAALRSYRIFADPVQELSVGVAAAEEVGPKVLVGGRC